MKSLARIAALLLTVLAPAVSRAQSTRPEEDVRSFELNAVAPPTPAMKYQLRYINFADRLPGAGVVLYLASGLLLGPDAGPNASKALDGFAAHDMTAFMKLAGDAADRTTVFQELDLAARREQCEWHPPYRERGGQ